MDVNVLVAKTNLYTQVIPNYYPWSWWQSGLPPWAFGPRELPTNIPEVRGEIAKVVAEDQKRRIGLWKRIDQLRPAAS